MNKYEFIVFLQGDDGKEAVDLLYEKGAEALLEYLKQWHYLGEHEIIECDDIREEFGTSDRYIMQSKFNPYFMCWNYRLGYCGLYFQVSE